MRSSSLRSPSRPRSARAAVVGVDGFVKAEGAPHAEIWDERMYEPVTQIDGNLAVVWAPYSFFLGPTLSHCGVNAVQLATGAEGWRILSLVDTRRRTGCRTGPGSESGA